MKLSEAVNKQDPKELGVPFDSGAILHIEYVPAKFTVRELEEMTKKRDPRVVIDQFLRVVHKWDLENDEGVIPLTVDALLDIDIDIFTHVITKVSEDQRASGEARSS